MSLAQDTYSHTTSLDALKSILDSDGHIKSLRHIAKESPDQPISVEPLPIPFRIQLPAENAYRFMQLTKEPDKVFLTRNGYLPNYGDVVITKRLGGSVRSHKSLNSIPEEHTTRRRLSLRTNADIYVPDEKYDEIATAYHKYHILPKSKLSLHAYGLYDRMQALYNKMKDRLVKEGGINSRYQKLFGSTAQLVGSEALGINVPDSSDTDVFVPYKRKGYFDRAVAHMGEKYPDLHMNKASIGREDKKTFTGTVQGKPVDVVLAYGPRAEKFRSAFEMAKAGLSEKRRAEIVREKQALKNAWFFPELRYKWYKKRLAEELGLKDAYF